MRHTYNQEVWVCTHVKCCLFLPQACAYINPHSLLLYGLLLLTLCLFLKYGRSKTLPLKSQTALLQTEKQSLRKSEVWGRLQCPRTGKHTQRHLRRCHNGPSSSTQVSDVLLFFTNSLALSVRALKRECWSSCKNSKHSRQQNPDKNSNFGGGIMLRVCTVSWYRG